MRFSYQLLPEQPLDELLGLIELMDSSVDTSDPYTAVLHLEHPLSNILDVLDSASSMSCSPFPLSFWRSASVPCWAPA